MVAVPPVVELVESTIQVPPVRVVPVIWVKALSSKVVPEREVVILKVPNYACWNRKLRGKKWCGYRFPDHVNYFTPETLRILAETADFRVRQTLWDRLPLSDNMYAVLNKAA